MPDTAPNAAAAASTVSAGAVHPALADLPKPADRTALMGVFTALGIAETTVEHRAVFSVDDGHDLKRALPGGHTKNLFLKSKKGELVLICALGETAIRLNRLHPFLGTARLSFGSEPLLWDTLGVRPGSVTLFALINDPERRVRLVLDAALLAHEVVNFHPLENTATTAIRQTDMMAFIAATGREAQVLDFAALKD